MHLITLNYTHTHTLDRTPLDEGLACRRDLYLTTHNTHKRKTAILSAVFEFAMPESEPPQTHALDRSAIRIGSFRQLVLSCIGNKLLFVIPDLIRLYLIILS